LLLGYAAFLRLYRLSELPPDEAMNGSNILENLETGRLQVFYPENGGKEGLYINLATPFVAVFGNSEWALRLPAALCGILTVWGTYLVAAELFSARIGLLACFFAASSFWHVNFSRIAFRGIAAPCLLVWSVYLLLVSFKRPRLMFLAGAVYGLGFYTYIAYRSTPLLIAARFLLYGVTNSRWTAGFVVAAVLIVSPLALYFAGHPGTFAGRAEQVSIRNAPHPISELGPNLWRTGRMFFVKGDRNWRHNVAWRAQPYWPVAALFACGILIPAVMNQRRGKRAVLVWLAMGAVPVVLSDDMLPHALRSLLLTTPAFVLAAVAADRAGLLLRAHLRPGVQIAAAAAVALWLAWEPYHTYFDVCARSPNVPPAFDQAASNIAAQVNALSRDLPKFVVAAPTLAQPIMYLTRSYTPQQQAAAHIRYLSPPPGIAAADYGRTVVQSAGQARTFCLEAAQ
jgi:4-amino-4-deoxy-L-arabinose transferase-like glycosyltransferase